MRHDNCTHRIAAALLGIFLLAGCGTPGGRRTPPAADLVWPPPPAPPRIRFIDAIGSPQDVGARRSLLDLLIGQRRTERLSTPVAMAVNSQGAILVADLSGFIAMIDTESRRFFVQHKAPGEASLISPVSVVVGPGDSLFVVDSRNNAIFIYDPKLKPVRLFAEGFDRPAGLVRDPKTGDYFVADAGAATIKRLSNGGELLGQIGGFGDNPDQLNTPTHIALSGDTLIVTDAYHFRIARYLTDGTFLDGFGKVGQVPGSFARPKGVTVDRAGNIYVVDALFGNVQIFDPNGSLLLFFGGTHGNEAGSFNLPNGILIDSENRIYVADTYHGRIQRFQVLTPAVGTGGQQ